MTKVDFIDFAPESASPDEIEYADAVEVVVRGASLAGRLALIDKPSDVIESSAPLTRRRAAREVIKSAESGGGPDIVRLYFDEISKYPLLEKEDEVRLAKLIEAGIDAKDKLVGASLKIKPAEKRWMLKAVTSGEEAKQEFIKSNLRLAAAVAGWYSSEAVPYLDRIQFGNLGLIHAVDKFDWRKGFKFSTYATWWIRQAVIRGIAETGRLIRLPIGQVDAQAAVYKARFALSEKYGRPPTAQEISDFTYKPLDEVMEILMFELDTVPLDGELSHDSKTTNGDIVADRNAVSPEEEALNTVTDEDSLNILDALDPGARQIVELVIGFGGYGERAKTEVARLLGLGKNQVTDKYNEAMSKLRHPSSPITIDNQNCETENTKWRRKAACLGIATRLFFPGRGENVSQAVDVCKKECMVSDECLNTALKNNEKYGIWGGKSERERRSIRRKRAEAKKLTKG